jgi:protein TonB
MRDADCQAVVGCMHDATPTHTFVLTELPDETLATRLGRQLRNAACELRTDPEAFVRSLFTDDAVDRQARRILWAVRLGLPTASLGGFALGVLLYLCVFGRPVVVAAGEKDGAPLRVWSMVDVAPEPAAKLAEPGGGGGGDKDPKPVSKGVVPPSSLADPIVPATTKPLPVPPSPLPVPPPLKAPPMPVDVGVFGNPRGVSGDPSDGPGAGGGAGTGKDGGWGAGEGPGMVDGTKGGPGGDDTNPNGGSRKPDAAVAVKARILNTPRPSYTEEARLNHTEGPVRVRVMLGADGRIRNARVLAGLPHGLNERALAAVSAIQFTPARDANGKAIDSWITVSVRFTIR